MRESMIRHYSDIIHAKEHELETLQKQAEYKQLEITQLRESLEKMMTLIVG